MPGEVNLSTALMVDHIHSEFDRVITNIQPGDAQDYGDVFMPVTVKELASVFSIPYDLPLPKRTMGDLNDVTLKKGSVSYNLTPASQVVSWEREADDFDMSKMSLTVQATAAGENFQQLAWLYLAELLEGTLGAATTNYYDIVPAAYDSLHLISSTTRGGVTNGNLQTGSGKTLNAINEDFRKGCNYFSSYVNTRNGNNIWKIGRDTRFLALIPGALAGVFEDYMDSKSFVAVLQNVAASENVAAVPLQTTWQKRFKYRVLDQLQSPDDWYLIIINPAQAHRKPCLDLKWAKADPYKMMPFVDDSNYEMVKARKRAIAFETYKQVCPMFWPSIIKFNN